jgi:hypothetical protein
MMKITKYLKLLGSISIDKIQLLTTEWSIHEKTWGLLILSIGMQLPYDGRYNYTTKTFAWVSCYNKSWHCGFLFFKIA